MGGGRYRPATARDLMRLRRIARGRRPEFKGVLRDLLNDEEVVKVGRDRYAAPPPAGRQPAGRETRDRHHSGVETGARHPVRQGDPRPARGQKVVAGRLQRHPRGFGFVVPDAGGTDVFVPPRALGDLLDGDRVAVRVVRDDGRGRFEGEIVRLLQRTQKRVMGVFHSAGRRGGGTVRAYDRLFETDIEISEGDAGRAEDGMGVGVEILRPPMNHRPAAGRIVEVLGFPDEPGIDLKTIIRKYDLREDYPPDVLAEAAQVPDRVTEEEVLRRENFRALPIVTIDGETAMDFDDAVLVRKNADGTYELQVHIADIHRGLAVD